MIHVTPREGLKVPDPEQLNTPSRHLPPEGRTVARSDYWTRRAIDGDVTISEMASADGGPADLPDSPAIVLPLSTESTIAAAQ